MFELPWHGEGEVMDRQWLLSASVLARPMTPNSFKWGSYDKIRWCHSASAFTAHSSMPEQSVRVVGIDRFGLRSKCKGLGLGQSLSLNSH